MSGFPCWQCIIRKLCVNVTESDVALARANCDLFEGRAIIQEALLYGIHSQDPV